MMKRWHKYEYYLLKGDWHVHTNYTDGKNTVFEYCKQAEENGLELIAFTEHVRKKLDYDFDDFVAEVYSAKDKFDLEILAGCEAKVLDSEGTLDVSDDILKECEIVLGVFVIAQYQVVRKRKIESFIKGYIQMQLYAPCNTQRDNNFGS